MSDAGPSVCVIGAGAIGLASALALVRRGAGAVTILESSDVGSGSSARSAGIVETQYLDPLDIELRVRSMRGFEQLAREHGLSLVRNGYLRLGHTPDSPRAFARSVAIQRDLGVLDASVLDPAQVARLVPDMFVGDVVAGLFGASDGYIEARDYCSLLAALVRREGVELLTSQELLGAEPREGGGLRLMTSGDQLDCDLAVDAAGAWAGHVAKLLGYELELIPQRRQAAVVCLERKLEYTMPSVMDYTPGAGEPGLYFRGQSPEQLIAGLHGEEAHDQAADPDGYARDADAQFLELLARKLASRLPSLAGGSQPGRGWSHARPSELVGGSHTRASGLVRGWAGLYPVSPTGRALLGPIARGAPVIVAGGAGGSGIQLAPVLGELVADWVMHGEPRAVAGAEALIPSADAHA